MTSSGVLVVLALLAGCALAGRRLFRLGRRLATGGKATSQYREMLHQEMVYLAGGDNAGTREIQDQWDRAVKSQNVHSLTKAFAGLLEQFRGAVDAKNQNLANLCYVNAVGLLAGAAISGGLNQRKIREKSASIKSMAVVFHEAFGECPATPVNADLTALLNTH